MTQHQKRIPKSFIYEALIIQGMLNDPSTDVAKSEKTYTIVLRRNHWKNKTWNSN
jgi:hypothetical protein